MARNASGERSGAGGYRSGLLGAVVALPVLAAVVVGASATRPPTTSDGAWTTPLQILLGIAGLVLVATMLLLLRNMEVAAVRPGGERRRTRTWVVLGLLAIAILALPRLQLAEMEVPAAEPFSFGPSDGSPVEVQPLPVSPTAVVSGLTGLALVVLGGALLARRALGPRRRDHTGPAARPTSDDQPLPPLEGTPTEVVIAAYATARALVVSRLPAGEHDPPGRLLARVVDTPLAAPLQILTDLHLPVRYGRREATPAEAEAARAALDQLRGAASDHRRLGGHAGASNHGGAA